MRAFCWALLLLAVQPWGDARAGKQPVKSSQVIDASANPGIVPVDFALLDEPDVTTRDGSVHFFTVGEDRYAYEGDLETPEGVIEADLDLVPTALVRFDGRLYLLGRSHFNYENRFAWYPVKDRKIANLPLDPLPEALLVLELADDGLNYAYKSFHLTQRLGRDPAASLQLLGAYLKRSPDFIFRQPKGALFLSYVADLVKALKNDAARRRELFDLLAGLLNRFPTSCGEGDLTATARSLLELDPVEGAAVIKAYARKVEAQSGPTPSGEDRRLAALKPSLTKIRTAEILDTEPFRAFARLCEAQGLVYETYFVDYTKKKDQGPDDGGLYYKRPAAALPDLNFAEGHGFHVALMYNHGSPFLEIKLAVAHYAEVLPVGRLYVMSPKRTFSREETAQILQRGCLPDEVFATLEQAVLAEIAGKKK